MYVVMESSAKKPASLMGDYRRIAVVHLNQEFTAKNLRPKMISDRARGVLKVIEIAGCVFHGKTKRCAAAVARERAEKLAYELNNSGDMATAEQLISTGSA